MKRLALFALLTAFAVPAAPAFAQDKMEESAYYPLKVGNTWTYKVNDQTIVNKVAKHEKVGDVMCAFIETSKGGQVVGKEHVRVTKDGIYRHTLNGVTIDPPVLLMKLPPKKGDEWKVNSKLGTETMAGKIVTTEEMVTVPAGKYTAFAGAATLEAMGQTVEVANYFVKDVGIAKITIKSGGQTAEVELTKFEAGK